MNFANYYTILTGELPLRQGDVAGMSAQPSSRATLEQLRPVVTEAASGGDARLLRDFFLKFDCLNLVRLLRDPDTEELDARGTLDRQQLTELVNGERGTGWGVEDVPDFLKGFADEYRSKAGSQGYFADDDILVQYYRYVMQTRNSELAEWYTLNFNLTNVMTALVARRQGWTVADYVRGEGDFCDALRTSAANDFGLSATWPYVADIIKIADETDPVAKEKKLDAFKWLWLDEHTFAEPFDIVALIAYLARVEMLDRWALLDVEQGRERFTQIIEDLRGEAQVPEEFRR